MALALQLLLGQLQELKQSHHRGYLRKDIAYLLRPVPIFVDKLFIKKEASIKEQFKK